MRSSRHDPRLAVLAGGILFLATAVRAGALAPEAASPPPAPASDPAPRPQSDAAKLEMGWTYRASTTIPLGPSPTAPVPENKRGTKAIPDGEEFEIAEVVGSGASTKYLVNAGRFGRGWVYRSSLDGVIVERSDSRPFDSCAAGKVNVRHALDGIALERAGLGNSASVKQLVELDSRIRKLMEDSCAAGFLDEATSTALGISTSHWSDEFEYSGRILGEAHDLDPSSPLRSHTLFGKVERYDDWDADAVPDLAATKTYLREFPKGPFAADAAWILARAYKMAYILNQQGLDCVSDQLSDVTSKAPEERKPYAKKMAEHYYQQAFRLRKPDQRQLHSYQDFRSDGTSYDYCSD